ncbi:hypothetical protein ACLOJK_019862 [Asimina triloba]
MDWAPKLHKQKSCSSVAGYFRSSSRSVKLGQIQTKLESQPLAGRRNEPKWQKLWRNLKKVSKRRVSDSSREPTYDLDAYLQNFDQGSGSLEPENLSRSFSVRFTGSSSNVFRRFA